MTACQRQRASRALACVGAVVGAGFASGRETTQFFSRYGVWSWALIALSSIVMSALCFLLIKRSHGCKEWISLYRGRAGALCRGCLLLLLGVTGGAMISAGGELAALTLPIHGAYPVGIVLTLGVAAILSAKSLKPLTSVSAVLTALLMLAALLILAKSEGAARGTGIAWGAPALCKAALFAAGYAGLNMAIAVGVVCECGDLTRRGQCRMPLVFGSMMLALMFLCNAMYLKNPRVMDEVLPMVALLRDLGKTGYYLGAILLYLAVMSTLIAILRTLRAQFFAWLGAGAAWLLCLLAPLCLSLVGFTNIVSSLYPWLGLLCLIVLLLPTAKRAA